MTFEELIALTKKADDSLSSLVEQANKPLNDFVNSLAPKLAQSPGLVETALQLELKKAVMDSLRLAIPEATGLAESFIGAATTAQSVTAKVLAAEKIAAETFAMAQTQGIAKAAQSQLVALSAKFGANLEAELKERITRAVIGTAVKRAKTAAFTAISGYQRGVQQSAYDPPQVENREDLKQDPNVPPGKYFVYVGPTDRITRPFCDVLVGKAIPDGLIDSLRNSQNLPFRRFCGGFNCRHTLVPVNHRYVIARNLSVVDESDVSRANSLARSSR